MPLFSYADYTFGAVMHGARRVQGSFTINYKRESYLFELLGTLRQEPPRVKRSIPGNSEAYRIAGTSGDPQDVELSAFPYRRFGVRAGVTYDLTALTRLSAGFRAEPVLWNDPRARSGSRFKNKCRSTADDMITALHQKIPCRPCSSEAFTATSIACSI